jgi:hypothetical protein
VEQYDRNDGQRAQAVDVGPVTGIQLLEDIPGPALEN